MSAVVLALGSVAFQDFEIPSGINFGGRQLLAVHQLTDGRRIVDSLGADEAEISFSGAFSGVDAALRARMLNSLRVAGGTFSLTWDVFCYTVVLSRFDANYENPIWIPYRISCTVVRDEAATVRPAPISLGNSLLDDLAAAADQCTDFGLDFTGVQSALVNAGATIPGSAAYVAAQSSMRFAQSSINIQTVSTEASIQTVIGSNSDSAESLVANLIASTIAAGQLAELTSVSAYVGRAARNLSNAST